MNSSGPKTTSCSATRIASTISPRRCGTRCMPSSIGTSNSPRSPGRTSARSCLGFRPSLPQEALKTFTTSWRVFTSTRPPPSRWSTIRWRWPSMRTAGCSWSRCAGYSEQENDLLGQIRVLEDADGDGHFDKSHVFADKLSWPTAILYYDGGVFVASGPAYLLSERHHRRRQGRCAEDRLHRLRPRQCAGAIE